MPHTCIYHSCGREYISLSVAGRVEQCTEFAFHLDKVIIWWSLSLYRFKYTHIKWDTEDLLYTLLFYVLDKSQGGSQGRADDDADPGGGEQDWDAGETPAPLPHPQGVSFFEMYQWMARNHSG